MSLRAMLVLVAFVAVALASLAYANDVWVSIVSGILVIVVTAALIIAIVDRGFRQAFAIGFVLASLVYALALATGITTGQFGDAHFKNIEMDQWEGRLPTTGALRLLHSGLSRSGYFDANGKRLPNFNPQIAAGWAGGGGGMAPGFAGPSYVEIPPREKFMPIGHCWWAMLLGYAGGLFALYVHRRRLRSEEKLPADIS
jgi:hypothetical protein